MAINILEATKTALDQMCEWRFKLTNGGKRSSGHWSRLSSTYGQTRRLRDEIDSRLHVVGCADITLELNEDDRNLLLSCVAHYLRNTEGEVQTELHHEQRDLISVAVDLATKGLADLPLPKGGGVPPLAFRELQIKVTEKARRLEQQALSAEYGFDAFATPDAGVEEAPQPQEDQTVDDAPLLDARVIRSPKVRAIAAQDLRALDRAMDARDHRLVTLHLRSILEATLLDFTMQRRWNLGFADASESWDTRARAVEMLGDAADEEHQALDTICAAEGLLRPFEQYSQPTSVTADDLDAQLAVVKKILTQLGYRSS